METGGNLLDVLKNLNGEQIQGLADKFLSSNEDQEYDQPAPTTIESLLEFANNNPEIAQQFLSGMSKKGEDTESIYNK